MDLSKPIFPAPPGFVTNLENPERAGEAANFWVGTIGMILSSCLLGIRMYTKGVLAKNITSDDVTLLFSWMFSMTIQIVVLYQYGQGLIGIHIWNLTGNQVNTAFNYVNMASILYCPFLGLAKFSLLFFYLKLSHLRWFRMCIFASMFLVVGYNIALIFPLIFACKPFIKNWDISITEGTCINKTPLFMATAVLNMVTDVLLLVLPIPMIVKLQMPRAQKAGIICIFGVGSATCITSAVRLALLFPMLSTIDQTWAIVMPGLWILIEANLVIITGCLPTMRLFFKHVAPKLIGESSIRSRSRSRNKITGYGNGTQTHQSELKTINSKHNKNPYNRMDDDGISIGSEERAEAGWQHDQQSTKSMIATPMAKGQIVQTKTTIISTEEAVNVGNNRPSWKAGF